MNICTEWRKNPSINPKTGRKIKIDGKVYNELKKKCEQSSTSRDSKSRNTCAEWKENPNINPLTGRKIKIGGSVYNKLKKQCDENNTVISCKNDYAFSKRISSATFNIIKRVGNIFPEYTYINGIISTKPYEYTVGSYKEKYNRIPNVIKNAIASVVDRLHDLDVFHGDLHCENIVFNTSNGDVRIIDFDCDPDETGFVKTRRISKLKRKDVNDYANFWNSSEWRNEPLKTVKDLIIYEGCMWTQ